MLLHVQLFKSCLELFLYFLFKFLLKLFLFHLSFRDVIYVALVHLE